MLSCIGSVLLFITEMSRSRLFAVAIHLNDGKESDLHVAFNFDGIPMLRKSEFEKLFKVIIEVAHVSRGFEDWRYHYFSCWANERKCVVHMCGVEKYTVYLITNVEYYGLIGEMLVRKICAEYDRSMFFGRNDRLKFLESYLSRFGDSDKWCIEGGDLRCILSKL